MPQGKGTYGSQVGRPPKKKGSLLNDDREGYFFGGLKKKILAKHFGKMKTPQYVEEELSKDEMPIQLPFSSNRTMLAEGGEPLMEDQMNSLAMSVAPAKIEEIPEEIQEQEMLPDEEMEEDYVDYIVNSTLSEEDKNYLESALTEDDKLSQIFDQIVENASEFSGSGPINGPGSEVSDSIPARLSDGEFVFTAKATGEIGEDSLMSMMKDAEAAADERQGVAYGGVPDKDKKADIAVSTQGSILAAGGIPPIVPRDPIREDQILSMQSSSPRRGYRTISG